MLLPSLTKPIEITPQGQMRVEGTFPTRPLQIQYALLFQQMQGTWHIDGVAVDAVPVEEAQAPVAATKPAAATVAQERGKAK